jgi:hypothetical protein
MRQIEQAARSSERGIAERVRELLASERVELGDADYELDGWHLAVIAVGAGAARAIRGLAASFDYKFLYVQGGPETIWAWIAAERRLSASDIDGMLAVVCVSGVSLVAGELSRGVEGFRVTHRQAQAALRVAPRGPQMLTRYADVALLASVLQDDVFARWLIDAYLTPLGEDHDGGTNLRQTLRAYFAAGGNAVLAARELGVVPRTVERRLSVIEKKLGHPIRMSRVELEIALRLEEFDRAMPLGISGVG